MIMATHQGPWKSNYSSVKPNHSSCKVFSARLWTKPRHAAETRPSPQQLHVTCAAVEQDVESTQPSVHMPPASGVVSGLFDGADAVDSMKSLRQIMNYEMKWCPNIAQLHQYISTAAQDFDHVNVVYAYKAVARMYANYSCSSSQPTSTSSHHSPPPTSASSLPPQFTPCLTLLNKLLIKHLGNFETRDVCQVLQSFSLIGRECISNNSIQIVCNRAEQMATLFQPGDCCMVANALGQLNFCHNELLQRVLQRTMEQVDDFSLSELQAVVWCFARLGLAPTQRFLDEVVAVFAQNKHSGESKDWSLLIWSLAKMHYPASTEFLDRLARSTRHRLKDMSGQDIANTVWALGKFRYKSPSLLEAVSTLPMSQLQQFKYLEILQLLMGFTHARYYSSLMFTNSLEILTPQLSSLTDREFATLLWSLGIFKHMPTSPDFAPSIVNEVLARLDSFTPQGLATVSKALGYLQCANQLSDRIAKAAEPLVDTLKPVEAANLLMGLRQMGHSDQRIYELVSRHMVRWVSMGKSVQTINLNLIVQACQEVGLDPGSMIAYAAANGYALKMGSDVEIRQMRAHFSTREVPADPQPASEHDVPRESDSAESLTPL